jgi:hypothetical protein
MGEGRTIIIDNEKSKVGNIPLMLLLRFKKNSPSQYFDKDTIFDVIILS